MVSRRCCIACAGNGYSGGAWGRRPAVCALAFREGQLYRRLRVRCWRPAISARAAETREPLALGSNTSSISINELAATLSCPAASPGVHYFNPVWAKRLVELVVGAATTPEPVEQVRALLAKTSKDAIVVTDTPGFASSRLGVLLGLKAIRMLQAGAASAHDIDRTMTEGYGHPMGPLRLTDLVGLDVRLDIAAYLERAYGERFATPELRRTLVRNGELGQKTGKGCYPG